MMQKLLRCSWFQNTITKLVKATCIDAKLKNYFGIEFLTLKLLNFI